MALIERHLRETIVLTVFLSLAAACHRIDSPSPANSQSPARTDSQARLPADQVIGNLRAGVKAGAPDVDLLGDGTAHYRRTFSGGAVATEEIVINGVRTMFTRHDGATTIQTSYVAGKPSRVVRTTQTPGSPPGLAVETTTYAANPADPDVRESYTADPASPNVTILREEDPNHDGRFSQTSSTTQDRVDTCSIPVEF